MRPARASTRSIVTAVAGAVILAACASAPGSAPLREVPGCYYFVQDQDARALRLPWGVRLRGHALTGWAGSRSRGEPYGASTLTAEGEQDHPFGYWLETPADSIEVGHPGGGGMVLMLAREGTALTGTARPVGDAGLEPARVRPVRLTWARCPEDGGE